MRKKKITKILLSSSYGFFSNNGHLTCTDFASLKYRTRWWTKINRSVRRRRIPLSLLGRICVRKISLLLTRITCRSTMATLPRPRRRSFLFQRVVRPPSGGNVGLADATSLISFPRLVSTSLSTPYTNPRTRSRHKREVRSFVRRTDVGRATSTV